MKTTVVHHSADFDGIFCREIARKFLPDAELIGWDYSDGPIPFPEGQVYVLDLSPECFESLPDINEVGRRLVWIDHHKSAIEKWPEVIPGYRIDGVAACRLAWQWFTILEHNTQNQTNEALAVALPGKEHFVSREAPEPLAVRLAGEYDIWDKRDPRAELFQHGLRSRDLEGWWAALLTDSTTKKVSISAMESMMACGEKFALLPNGEIKTESIGERCVDNLLQRGEAIQYAKTKENESIITHQGFTIDFEGLKFIACNHARYNSHLFTAGLKPEHDACFGFKFSKGKWEISLYHAPGKEHHDLSKIAVKYGGGGHRGACGFRIDKLPFIA